MDRRSSKPLKKSQLTYQIKKQRKFQKRALIYSAQVIKKKQKPTRGRPRKQSQTGSNAIDSKLIKIQFSEQNNNTQNLKQKQQQHKKDNFFSDAHQDQMALRKNKLMDSIENQKRIFNRNYLQKMKNLQRFDQDLNQRENSNNQEQTQFNPRQELTKYNANIISSDDSDKNYIKIEQQHDTNQNSKRIKQSSNWNFKNFVQTTDKQRLSCSLINDKLNQLNFQKPKAQQRQFSNSNQSTITTYEQICKKIQSQVFQNYKKSYHYSQSLNLNPVGPENIEMIKKQFMDSLADKMKIILGETAMKCRVPVARVIFALQKSHF